MNVMFGGGQSGLMNIHRINQSLAARNGDHQAAETSRTERRDSLTISPQGKKNSLLESLMKQKARITEQKNALIGSTLENGGTMDAIQTQLETYEVQMKSIDEQIAAMMAQDMAKQTEKPEQQDDGAPKTAEEIQNERLAGVTRLSSDLQQAETIRCVQVEIDRNVRVLKSEIAQDQASTSTPGAEGQTTQKEAMLARMEQRSTDLTSAIAEKLSDVSEQVEQSNEHQEILTEDEAENIKEDSEPEY